MEISDYKKKANEDCDLSQMNIKSYSSELPLKSVKWFNYLYEETRILEGLSIKKRILFKQLHLYYSGLSEEAYEYNLDKVRIKDYILADDKMVALDIDIFKYQQKVTYIGNIIDNLNKSSFQVKNIIEWEKFKNGG
jgi:hypothetical protein